MDLSRFTLPDLSPLAVPEGLVAALVSAVATLVLVAGFAPRLVGARPGRAADPTPRDAASCDFLIDGSSLKALSEPARALVDGLPAGGSRLAALAAHYAADCPDLQADIETLVLYGVGFRHHCPRGDGTAFEIVGEPRGGAAYLSIRAASEEARALNDAETALARAGSELGFLRDLLDRAPVMAWSHGPDGQVVWANAPYRERFDAQQGELPDHRIADAFGHVLEEVPMTPRGPGNRRRVSVPSRENGEPRWFEVSQGPGAGGETVGYALEVDDLVAAEASLRRFVETLTETFAHLPIGLAVFDKNRRLGLFNPALTDLVKIDAVWLAGRPSLRDFLERLRETRQMPEQKDFASWRRKLSELEEGAREGTYEENWQLPSGKIFRVTGRPHPQGALAFLFEDISTAIQLERKYRSELELSQATLDRMSEAVAVFDTSGMLVFVNSAFERLWGLDPMQGLDGPGVAEMTAIWAERCAPSPVWAQLAEFATAAEARTSWTAMVETRAGARLEVLVAPLPDASALVVFREPAADRADAAPAAPAFDLDAAGTGPLAGVAAALAERGLRLVAPEAAAGWTGAVRQVAMALALAAADAAAPGATVELSADGAGLTARVAAAGAPRAESVGLALARRLVREAGGSLEAGHEAGNAVFTASLAGAQEGLRSA
jgi:PAS domain-containing protein